MAAVSGSKRFLLIAGRKTHAWGDAQPEGRRIAERHCQSVEKIENAFVEALQAKKLSQISVSDVCKAAEMNRSSFLPILWTFTPFPIKQGRIWKMSSINCMPRKSSKSSTATPIRLHFSKDGSMADVGRLPKR
ncbi:hypothetical protein [Butyricicoccus sp. Marseille-Q5471]|uniref:hypothetical protein n=1 Tax=Butyricicoccus sp. Marseille-Q5471 TaxID=3039493 RepID=UPI002F423A46